LSGGELLFGLPRCRSRPIAQVERLDVSADETSSRPLLVEAEQEDRLSAAIDANEHVRHF